MLVEKELEAQRVCEKSQKVLAQNLKYQLQCRWSKYSEVLQMLRTQKKQSVKRCVARLAQENDALEDELAQMAECWRSTSRLMEGELMQAKAAHAEALRRNEALEGKLVQNGLSVPELEEDASVEKEREDGEDEAEIAALWNDDEEDVMSSSSHFIND